MIASARRLRDSPVRLPIDCNDRIPSSGTGRSATKTICRACWAEFKLGHTWDAAEYAQMAAELATHMKRADSRVRIGVNGMTPKCYLVARRADVRSHGGWPIQAIVDLIDFLVTHQYSWVANYMQWRDAGPDWEYARNVTAAVEVAEQFAPGKPIAITEWSAYSPSRKTGRITQTMPGTRFIICKCSVKF